jgi:Dienelactone hydrolase family
MKDSQPLTRRAVLQSLAAGVAGTFALRNAGAARAAEVSWLREVQQPPARVPREPAGALEPLLVDAEGRPIETLAGWKRRRQAIRDHWLAFLGPMPERRPAARLEVLQEDRPAGAVRQLVRYESEPGEFVEGYLLRPAVMAADAAARESASKRPAVVALHPTTPDTIDQIAGKTGREDQQLGLRLCRRGFVVFCPRCFLWQSADGYEEAVARFRKRHPGTLGMHKMLYDAMRAVDALANLPDVDARRIGACGHSLGAKETLYLAAFDERIAGAVASEGGIGFSFTNWDAPWYLGPAIREPDFSRNHHELLALIAPRPFLILAGESGRGAADGDRTWPFVEAALPVYRLYGEPARLGLFNHRQGHSIPPAAFERMAAWLAAYLAPAG